MVVTKPCKVTKRLFNIMPCAPIKLHPQLLRNRHSIRCSQPSRSDMVTDVFAPCYAGNST